MCVCWKSSLTHLPMAFPEMFSKRKFVDVTLVCEGRRIHCHRVVLATYSSYFEEILEENPTQHPIIILPRDVKFWMIQALVDFMYRGEVNVEEDFFEDLVKCAEMLQIRGFRRSPETGIDHPDLPEEMTLEPKIEFQEFEHIPLHADVKTELPKERCNLEILHVSGGGDEDDLSSLEDPSEPSEQKSRLRTFPKSEQEDKFFRKKRKFNNNRPDIKPGKLQNGIETQECCSRNPETPCDLNLIPPMMTPPDNFSLPRRRKYSYSRETMWSAMMSVHNGMSVLKASILYDVPSGSLYTSMKKYGLKTFYTAR